MNVNKIYDTHKLCEESQDLGMLFGNVVIFLILWTFFYLFKGQVASGLPEIKLPPFRTTIGNETLYFTDMITHIGSSIIALPLISILESIAVAKAFGEFHLN